MKTLAILFIALSTTVTSFASVVEPLATTVEGNIITVNFEENNSQTVNISIIDRYGIQLLSEKVQTENRISRAYNLKHLPKGVYTLKMESDQRIISKKVSVEKNEARILSEKITFKPTSTFKNNRWNVNHFAQGEQVTISILDADYNLVFEDKIKDQVVIGKSYNLKELPYGTYNLVLSTGEKTYTKVIAKM